jgi:hypothetical protein
VALLLAGLSACAGPSAPEPLAGPTPSLQAVATQIRGGIANSGVFRVTVTNTGAAPFTLTGVRLDSPAFVRVPDTPVDIVFAPQQATYVETTYGDVRCDAPIEPLRARLRLREAAGEREVVVPLESPFALMQRIHDLVCAEEDFATRVRLAVTGFVEDEVGGVPVVRSELRLTRGATDAPLRVGELRGNLLYELAGEPFTLGADSPSGSVPVVLRIATCSGHVIGELSQRYRFTAAVSVGEAPEFVAPILLDDQQKKALEELVDRACP